MKISHKTQSYPRYLLAGLLIALSLLPYQSQAENEGGQHPAQSKEQTAASFTRSVSDYALPDLQMVRQDGKKVDFSKELDDGRVVVLNFIYASCNAICPMLSYILAKAQTKLGTDSDKVHFVSISLDPESDTPAKLLEYADKFKAGKGWDHYTGSFEASIAIQKALGAFRGNKMNHAPITFIRQRSTNTWTRLDGFASPDDVVREIQAQLVPAGVS
jgi:protein SCO1/2